MVLKTSGDLGEVTISNNVISEIAGAVGQQSVTALSEWHREIKKTVNFLKPDSMTGEDVSA